MQQADRMYICLRMFWKRIFFVFCIFHLPSFFIHLTFSQSLTQTVRGTVADADSKSPLEFVGVKVLTTDSSIYSVTDVQGRFRLSRVPVGRHSIKFSFIGYEEAVLQNIVVTSGKEIVLNVEMHEKLIMGKEVEIVAQKDKTKANNDLVTNSARNFQSEETERYAGSRGDPSKMVANYAGVATGNDARNDIIVRGNSPLGVLWRLENTDIPNPNHFSTQGATGGPVSILNNNLLGSSDFLTGAFPAEYGNKTAAVFDLKMRNGNNEKTEFTGQLGLNGLEAGVEGPLRITNDSTNNKLRVAGNSSYLINYRYSTLKLFQLAGIRFGVSGIPQYQDVSFKINIPTQKSGVFSLWGIGGMSNISLLDSEKDSADWSFTDFGEDLIFGSKMGVAGISHLYFFNNKVSGKLNLSVSGTQMLVTLDTLSSDKKPYRIYKNNSIDRQYFGSYTLTDKISSHHLIKVGIIWKNYLFNYHAFYWSRKYKNYFDEFNDNGRANAAQAFLHWQYRISDNLVLNNGIHYNSLILPVEQNTNLFYAIEPRTGIRWQFRPKQTISAAFGMHSQSLPLVYYVFRSYDSLNNQYVRTNTELDFSKSLQYVLGYDFNFVADARLKIESYYQDSYSIPVERYRKTSFSALNIGNELEGITLVDSLWNKGTGFNYGTEITIEKFFNRKYYFLNTLSLYESKYRGSDEVLRHTAFSGGYVYNLLGGVELPVRGKKHLIGLDLKITFAGGNRYTPIDLQKSVQLQEAVYIDSLAFSKKFYNYQKVDLKISCRMNSKKASHYFFVHIENIFNRKNILQQVYNQNKQTIIKEYQLGLFPYGGYRVEF